MSTLAIMPTFLRGPDDLSITLIAIESLRRTAPELDLFVIDDHSPVDALAEELESFRETYGFRFERNPENVGFSRTVNVGMRRAETFGLDALLVNADIEFFESGWLERLRDTRDPDGELAAVAGGLLLYPNGLIQHAGTYFSLLSRDWNHWYRFAPSNLPEAQTPRVCPVTAALHLIRYETIQKVGIYDEDFRMGWEDVDYCLRCFNAGLKCVYNPTVRAVHHESLFRGTKPTAKVRKWTEDSWRALVQKHHGTSVQAFVPAIV